MSEEQVYKGDRWTDKSRALLAKLGWVQQGDSNVDIPCTKHQGRTEPHGLDLVFTYSDPFQMGQTVGVIVESKSRKWNGIVPSTLKEFVEQVTGSLECATLQPEFRQQFPFDGPVNMGLVLVWCNDRDAKGYSTYNHQKYLEYLNEITLPNKRKEFVVFVACNHDILRWVTLNEHLRGLRGRKNGVSDLEFFYPSIHGSPARLHSQLTLPMMFSDYVFCKGTKDEDGRRGLGVTVVYSFAQPTLGELRFMHDALKKYQLLDNRRELQVYLPGADYDAYRGAIEQFRREVRDEYAQESNNAKVIVECLPMAQLVPDGFLEEEHS